QIQKKLILPILRPVAHRGIEHAAFSMHPRPRRRVGRALVALALHAMGVKRKNYMKIGCEIFQRVPLFVEADWRGHAFEPWKFRVVDDQVGVLQPRLPPVNNELGADHCQVWQLRLSPRYVATCEVWGVRW